MQESRPQDAPPVARPDFADAAEVRLLARVQAGEREALRQLYQIYFPRLARFLDRFTRQANLIEEVINDTMLVVWQSAERFNHTSKVSTWIFAIAYRKGMKAIGAFDAPQEEGEDELVAPDQDRPDAVLARQQLAQQVAAALDALPLLQRTVVNLTYYHGMGYEEIAAIMDCPVNTVKTRMFHARQRLRQLLAGLGE